MEHIEQAPGGTNSTHFNLFTTKNMGATEPLKISGNSDEVRTETTDENDINNWLDKGRPGAYSRHIGYRSENIVG